jgi:hypothetical protein
MKGYDATMWLLVLWKEISGQDLDAQLVTDSESLQQKALPTDLPTEKRLRIDMASNRHGFESTWLCFVKICVVENTAWCGRAQKQPGESTDEGSSWRKPNDVG